MKEQVPSVGCIVHYVLKQGSHAGEDRPAIVLRTIEGIDIHIFLAEGDADQWWTGRTAKAVEYSEDRMPLTWHWPDEVQSVRQSFSN